MAIYYLSKAVKFLEKSNDKTLTHPNQVKGDQSINPNENLNNSTSQKSHEIIFNYGLALFKSQKYYEAFKCFEKVSLGIMKQNPKLWYYMSLCSLYINKDLYQRQDDSESEVYHHKQGYGTPQYEKKYENQTQKRFVLAGKGDLMSKMENIVKDYE